ncbi:porin [Bradyrhizobium algeriense]|uniref:porin n=1 Tax=Bradyrhizobium algeriense TaxID=634784 RepID=UPI000D370FF0|nr:porin [Bradyrhizobium algeriense]
MKMVKGFMLCSAAGLLAMSGAQAADLPVKAKAVEYVRICSLYGAGFFYIPGTDTCIKLGGYLRVDTTFNGSPYDEPAWAGDQGQGNRYRDYFASRSRMALTVDTRTATEYGVVRTFGQLDWSFASPSGSVREVGFAGQAGGLNNGQQIATEMLFIQFAGFTFGRSASAYATPWHGYPGNNTSFLVGGHDTVTGTNNIQYTAQFGNGVSGTIGLDDPLAFNRTSVYNLATGGASLASLNANGAGVNAYAGVHTPDIVGNIRVDQAWGLFQISGALHEVNGSYNNLTLGAANNLSEISGHPESKWGGSVMAALQIKNIPTGAGDDIKMDVSWGKGDIKNVIGTSAGVRPFQKYSSGAAGTYQSIGFANATDGVYLPVSAGGDGSIHLTEGFGFRGAFNHNWDPYWSTSLFGGYAAVRYDGTAKASYCAAYAASNTGAQSVDFSCNPDFNLSQIGLVTRWTPVKNLTFSAEVLYFHLDQKFSGSKILTPANPKPTAIYQYKDQDTVSLNIRAQRNF